MEQFLIDNTPRFVKLVNGFKPGAAKARAKVGADSDSDMLITARMRPLFDEEKEAGMVPAMFPRPGTDGLADIHELRRPVRGLPTLNSWSYQVDRLFTPEQSTEEIYTSCVEPLVPWAWGGGVSTVFAYGQTGSGKTYTISRFESLVAETLMSGSLDGTRNIFVSIIELAGNAVFDLLNSRKPVSLLEDSFGSTHIAGASEYQITDAATLLQHVETAASFRRTAATQKNDSSSRSHAICKIRLENPDLPQADDGLLYLIDLAGSEVARDVTEHSASRIRETREINVSLSTLKDCIRGRAILDNARFSGNKPASGKKTYIPFRQSALTKLLKHVFDPDTERSCRTVVVACVNPSLLDVGASRNTLRYAEMLRADAPAREPIKFEPSKPSSWSNDQLRDWIGKSSGTPPVSAEILAPRESGKQLLSLPVPEFITRCRKTPGVTTEQATAFHSKFWRLHVDSQRASALKTAVSEGTKTGVGKGTADEFGNSDSSRDSRPEMAEVLFKERIRPGMVVSWTPPSHAPSYMQSANRNLAVVLSKEDASSGSDEAAGQTAYRCALVAPGILPGAFDVGLWRQWVIPVHQMLAEVLLEYDAATRYYYEVV